MKYVKSINERALDFLYKLLKKKKIERSNAESKTGVKQEELNKLDEKIEIIDFLVGQTIREWGKEE